MKSKLKITALSLIAVAASAHAQTTTANGFAYWSTSWSGGAYTSFYRTGYGSYNYAQGNASSYEFQGYGGASAAGPGSGLAYGESYSDAALTFWNPTNSNVTESITILTSASAAVGWTASGQFGIGYGVGEAYDSAGLIFQEDFAESLVDNIGYDSFYHYGYSSWDFNGSYGGGYYYGPYQGNFYDFAGPYGSSLTGYYTFTLSPGASDTIYYVEEDGHESISTTPGPVAVAPFALGLIGALRRRKKA